MPKCTACHLDSTVLDHETCPACMLAASQALVTAADKWRESIAQQWIKTHHWQDDFWAINALYDDSNAYIRDLIDWQSDYHTAAYNASLDHAKQFWADFWHDLARHKMTYMYWDLVHLLEIGMLRDDLKEKRFGRAMIGVEL